MSKSEKKTEQAPAQAEPSTPLLSVVLIEVEPTTGRLQVAVDWKVVSSPVKFCLKLTQIFAQMAAQRWDEEQAIKSKILVPNLRVHGNLRGD